MNTGSTGQPTMADLATLVASGEIDTVTVGFTDMQGRLVGKRVAAGHFIDEVAEAGVDCCGYLLAVDVENDTVPGYPIADWDTGYGDMVMRPDPTTLHRVPWLPGSVQVLADLFRLDGSAVSVSPRQILARQLDRLAERGLTAYAATELEFIVFDDSYRQAWVSGYRDLTPATYYNADYGLVAGARLEPLLRDIRGHMTGAGLRCEGVKGECHIGQQEITFHYEQAMRACDHHVVYKNGAKEIADQHGKSITFMAKYDQREGNSCHVHLSLRDADGSPVFADPEAPHGMSGLFRGFLAGVLASLRELTLCYAPNINSYKRFADGSFAPTAVAWGLDNRSCALRVLGHGSGMRVECRVPGGDVNPYLAVAALIAGGLHGLDGAAGPAGGSELPEPVTGSAYDDDRLARLPATLAEAAELFAGSAVARKAFGDDVVEHYLNNAKVELQAFNAAVTDWERVRGFERF